MMYFSDAKITKSLVKVKFHFQISAAIRRGQCEGQAHFTALSIKLGRSVKKSLTDTQR